MDYKLILLPADRLIIYGTPEQIVFVKEREQAVSLGGFAEFQLIRVLRYISMVNPICKIIPFEMTYFHHLYCRDNGIETNTKLADFFTEKGVLKLHSLAI